MKPITLILIALALAVCESAKRCPPGNFISKTGACLSCRKGTFNPRANKNFCKPCPANKIATDEGSTKCIKCPKNTEPSSIKDKCICVEGAIEIDGECRKCEPGTFFQSFFGVCTDCIPGYFQPDYGQSDCLECPRRTFSGSAATECITCEDDEDFNVREGKCVRCKAGYYHDEYSACTECLMDTYKPKPGSGACLLCPPGSYSNLGSEKCTKCPKGTALMKKGKCGSCAAGERYSETDRNCVKCSINRFTPHKNVLTSCIRCRSNEFALEGSGKCVKCPKGKFLMKNGKCRSCPSGSVHVRYDLSCSKCRVNQFTRGDKDFCELCPPGTYSFPESATCFPCAKGKALILAKKKCGKCPPGRKYSIAEGTCDLCYQGFVKDRAGIQDCTECPPGTTSNDKRTKCVVPPE